MSWRVVSVLFAFTLLIAGHSLHAASAPTELHDPRSAMHDAHPQTRQHGTPAHEHSGSGHALMLEACAVALLAAATTLGSVSSARTRRRGRAPTVRRRPFLPETPPPQLLSFS